MSDQKTVANEQKTPEQPRWFACREDCGKAITGTDEEAIRGAIWLHKMDGCDD